jgi:phosphoenolpyruvate carboxylase
MPLNQEDYREILRHLRQRLREEGAADIDERLSTELRPSEDARADLLRYMEVLTGFLKQHSRRGYGAALRLLREYVYVEGGEVEGIEIRLTPEDQEAYNVEVIDLAEQEDYAKLVEGLERLYNSLLEEPLAGNNLPTDNE